MTKVDIFSGFLGAGKTTLIKKLLSESYQGQKVVLIENEFGEIGIDGGFMQEAGISVTEMNSGCICCSLVGDFGKALSKVVAEYAPDRILIEPSGVGKLSDVIRAVEGVHCDGMVLNAAVTVVDAKKCRMHMKNFGEFFNNQLEHAACIVLSHTDGMDEEKLTAVIGELRAHNAGVEIISTPWDILSGDVILAAMERRDTLAAELARLEAEPAEHHHHHHHHDGEECDDPECECHHHHHGDEDEDEDEHEHHHHHHHHDGEECDDPECECHHHHHGEGHHHADEVFVSIGAETPRKYSPEEIRSALSALTDEGLYGNVLRAKGYVASTEGGFIHFDYVPGEPDVRTGPAMTIGRLCVIGSKLEEDALRKLFRVE